MIRNSVDLYSIATSGVNASSKLLQTTSNNIANVNSEGYVRERTVFASNNLSGVGQGSSERIINVFAQNQMRRDITSVGEWSSFQEKTQAIDNLLASEANALSTGFSDFFASLQTAADDPTNLASRNLVLSEGESILRRMSTVSDFMEAKEDELNLEFTSRVNHTNSLINTIGDLNKAILVAQGNGSNDEPTDLLNQRDTAINELAELVSIDVRDGVNGSGSVVVSLTSGESLVLEDGTFNVFDLGSDADATFKQLQLSTNYSGDKANTSLNISETDLGGILGGLFRFRDEVLGPAQRDIGQLAVAFTDAVNTQNQLGMDLDFQLGGELFSLPEFHGVNYNGTPDNLLVNGQFTPGASASLIDGDFKITVTDASGGVPSEVTVALLNGDGTPKLDENNDPIEYTGIAVGTGFTTLPGGIDVEFESTSGFSIGDEFLMQPLKYAASDITMATTRPEDLAFASPTRIGVDLANLGDASVSLNVVSNTTVDATLSVDASAFDGDGGIHGVADSPSATVGAPVNVVFTSESSFEVYDGESPANLITTVSGVTDYNNLLAQAKETSAWPAEFSALDDYPGYDFSLEGIPVAGDSFTVVFNTDGVNDNTNAIAMADLQQRQLVQLSANASSKPRTLHESYASLVSSVGEDAASANIALQAAEAMKEQSSQWFESVSGVSLDEEAANLVRYQQSYAASARILSTAQELFDTILSAVR
jgi:flagellar hook-associated protein 1 FlgK